MKVNFYNWSARSQNINLYFTWESNVCQSSKMLSHQHTLAHKVIFWVLRLFLHVLFIQLGYIQTFLRKQHRLWSIFFWISIKIVIRLRFNRWIVFNLRFCYLVLHHKFSLKTRNHCLHSLFYTSRTPRHHPPRPHPRVKLKIWEFGCGDTTNIKILKRYIIYY